MSATPNIVLTGFMGTGKTAAGRIVAERLGREFVDMDGVIQARQAQTVSEIFETRGETFFRACEEALCAELAARENLVIATGGGALVDAGSGARNRAAFAGAFVVCLDATLDELVARLARHAQDRPLLAGGELRERVAALASARRAAYAQIQLHLDATAKTVQHVADQIIEMFQEQASAHPTPSFQVRTPGGSYPIFIGQGLLEQVGALAAGLNESFSARCALITNPRVGGLYSQPVLNSLRTHGFEPREIQIPDGEPYKTLDTVRAVYDQLIEAELDRRSIVLALGGGVVGDLAGFVAATFLRGVPFVQLPTTLLAMVDASIGGKVAVDHPRGKNLIGAFKQPCAVVADTATLSSLPAEEWRSGMAEVVKHGLIGDAGLFERLEACPERSRRVRDWMPDMPEIVTWLARAIQVKVDIVTRDPFEQNERAKLNLGHTFGHALEKASGYTLRHGDAVAIGLVCAAHLSARRKLCTGDLPLRVERVLSGLGLPVRIPSQMQTGAILEAMKTDKKRLDQRQRFILPRAVGDVAVVDDVTRDELDMTIEIAKEKLDENTDPAWT
jgi:shikimate kinase/3-dehydroquinate synthase